jgi:hypothetical protein
MRINPIKPSAEIQKDKYQKNQYNFKEELKKFKNKEKEKGKSK